MATAAPAVATAARAVAAVAAPDNADDEGGTRTLRVALEEAAKAHIDAQARLEASRKRQAALALRIARAESQIASLTTRLGVVAGAAYRRGRISGPLLLLAASDRLEFLERTTGLETIAALDDARLRDLRAARADVDRARTAIDDEVREQAKQVEIQAKRRKDAEQALAAAGGGGTPGGFADADSVAADPAPRRADGEWPAESCTVGDPTTRGCVTPRTLHVMRQSRADGFRRFVSCYRSGGGGEHPRGRACDFAAAPGGFEDVNAAGDDREYGDRLAAYLVHNADALGVLYVIWYRRIWMPGTGWQSYGARGGPAATHTNHVHVSMY
ncbi:coiled-coil domain-containing protein [Catenuloplanes sp. NPDC051500]|uniref:coiled-coil domain-containing protein n=1 Tax=Catenuloplanes sp. NPDC051500 TaxID=3363959 RepID=UPI0037BD93BD